MEDTCKDRVFGKMTYKHRWYKQQSISMFGKDWVITVAAKAYRGKPITQEQQTAYKDFCANERMLIDAMSERIKAYINQNLDVLAEEWETVRPVSAVNELAQLVAPKTLLFKQDGTTLMLLDCVWDIEDGIAVKLNHNMEIGRQDLFL